MRRIPIAFAAVIAAFMSAPTTSARSSQPRQLTFEDRVKAQEAIERVYYSHQLEAKARFDEAVPRTLLEQEVRTYLKRSAALQTVWNTSVTGEALERERERLVRETRFPERLRELFAALGDDSFLIEECFVRQVLVDRLARGFFSSDERIHGSARREAEKLRIDLKAGRVSARDEDPRREVIDVRLRRLAEWRSERPNKHGTPVLELDAAEFNRWRSSMPRHSGEISEVMESAEAFVISTLLSETGESARIATYRVPKVSWGSWWERSGEPLQWQDVRAVSKSDRLSALIGLSVSVAGKSASPQSCDMESRWTRSFAELPKPQVLQKAVWTGTLMLVWGGSYGNGPFDNQGNRYDPLTDTWTVMSTINAPAGRFDHAAVWTGEEMIIWGGISGGYTSTGGRYNPQTDSWLPTSTSGAPVGGQRPAAVWTGAEMIVWGGPGLGGRYSPAMDSWSPVSTIGEPEGRIFFSGVWTGSSLVIWGGQGSTSILNTGARYDPASDTWHAVTLTGAPSPRRLHSAVWTGTEMIVWGAVGAAGTPGDGGRYDPINDTWSPVSVLDAPETRTEHSAVWTGERMLVWGGNSNSALNTGGAYDPYTNSWSSISTTNAPAARWGHSAIWTGELMIVWGANTNTGGRYDLRTDSWTPTSVSRIPSARTGHTSVWTGNLMIIWGGTDAVGSANTGARYDPVTDSWTSTSAPAGLTWRYEHKAVWTGSEMIVWAGNQGLPRPTGDRYDPSTDSWMPMSTVHAPFPEKDFTAVWTGTEMIVWSGDRFYNGGGRYNPATNTWSPTSTTNAPGARVAHTAVWTGTEMIVWGGENGSYLNTGGRYNPITNTWVETSNVNAPLGRINHTAVWSGTEMIIWGGRDFNNVLLADTGSRYNPISNTWAPSAISTSAVRSNHTAAWNGWAMVVWGGVSTGGSGTGGIYDPISDSFTPTALDNAPSSRYGHTSVWTSRGLIVWGGTDGYHFQSTGGILSVTHGADTDGDGLSACEGDCDDSQAAIYPGAPQICDGLNDDCADPTWPTVPSLEGDGDGDGARLCANDCNDSRADIYPGAPQVCGDNVNNDCDDPGWPDPGETDQDLDGFKGCAGDCDDTQASVFPGAPALCDGINNDCSDWRWPQVWVDEIDADQDGAAVCAGDCDDSRPQTHPGAPEVNDGLDNQCPGEQGYGIIDEISGELSWLGVGPSLSLCWSAQGGAGLYLAARSGSPLFSGACSMEFTQDTCWNDSEVPLPGQAHFYLVRLQGPSIGSWGEDSAGDVRSNICTAPAAVYSLSFVDNPSDNLGATSLRDFFTSVAASPSSYLLFEVDNSPIGGAICSERADFHRDQYLALGGSYGVRTSGSWNKWYRDMSNPWSGPITTGFSNYYGGYCDELWAWCPDYEFGNLSLFVRPSGPDSCEIAQGYPEVCGDGTWRLKIRISEDRFVACGF